MIKPSGSTRICRFRPITFFPASKPRTPGWVDILTLWLSRISLLGFFTGFFSHSPPRIILDFLPDSLFLSAQIIIVNQPPRRHILRQHLPSAANTQQIKNRVKHRFFRIRWQPSPPQRPDTILLYPSYDLREFGMDWGKFPIKSAWRDQVIRESW